MDELDFLKNHWKKESHFPKVDVSELKNMLQRNSTSVVRWIFIISVLELFVGVVLGFCLPRSTFSNGYEEIITIISDGVFYGVILYFIWCFLSAFIKIKSTSDTKTLLSSILLTRKYVDQYIKFNIYFICFDFASGGFFGFYEKNRLEMDQSVVMTVAMAIFFIVILSICLGLFILIVKFYYKLLYGRFLKKLENNFDELQMMETKSQSDL